MTLKNCAKCGRMFAGDEHQKFCSKCVEDDDEMFKIVREYVYDNPKSTVKETADATDVPEEKILKFLRQGKLTLKGDGVGLECERCGKSITTGRFCDQCAKEMNQGFKQAFGMDKKPEAPKASHKEQDSRGMYIKK